MGAELRALLRGGRERLRRAWRWLTVRRLRFTQGGAVFTVGSFAVGLAAINTGNNLLYLLLGAMLGFMAVSGWLSEQVLRGIELERSTPRGTPVERPVRISYHVRNRWKRIPILAVEIREEGLHVPAWVASVAPGETGRARSENHFVQRGVYPLDTIILSTSFPFGLFRKERDLHIPGELVIWPRTDRSVREPLPAGGRAGRKGAVGVGAPGSRGEYRGLKEYRPGDDPRDIHWRSTARLGDPVVREYDRDDSEAVWLCLDTRGEPGEAAEAAVETAAALAARASRSGRRFGLETPRGRLDLGTGPGQLERVLDALARVDFRPDSPRVSPRADPASCVLISLSGRGAAAFGDVFVVAGEAA